MRPWNPATFVVEWNMPIERQFGNYHGGCQMGRVVDRDYRVGVDALRVVDGSTFEFSPGTNPQATVMMLGRKTYLLQKIERFQGARAEVKYVDGEEAKRLATEEGYTILDIRDKSQYDRAHIPFGVHVPLFIDNTDNDIGSVIKRALHTGFSGLFYGVAFTKPNPQFISEVEKKISKDQKLLVVCQEGLRSGAAAEKLEEAGFQNLAYITSGLQSVKSGTFPKEGPKELEDAGKAGLVTVQGKFSAILGSFLVVAYLFLTLFPDQAEQLFFKTDQ